MTDSALAPTGPAAGVVSAGEHARIASAAADAQAPSTRRAYAGQWARFAAWCRARGAEALPAAPVLVAAYLTERAETAKISTVRVAAAAIAAAHRARGADDPTGAASVRAVVAGIARQHAAGPENAPRQAAPSPRAGVLPVSGVARHARPDRMYGKLLDCNRKLVEARLDDMLKAQRQAVDRIVHRHRQLGAVLLDPDVSDDELRGRLLSTVPAAQLREDQSDLANWTRGDRKARFEQAAGRHAGLS